MRTAPRRDGIDQNLEVAKRSSRGDDDAPHQRPAVPGLDRQTRRPMRAQAPDARAAQATAIAAALPSRGEGGGSMPGLLESATRSGGAPGGSLTTAWPSRTFTPETRCWNRYTVAPPGSGIAVTGFSSPAGALAAFSFAATLAGAAEAEAGTASAASSAWRSPRPQPCGLPAAPGRGSASLPVPPSIAASVTATPAQTSTITGSTIGRRRSRS